MLLYYYTEKIIYIILITVKCVYSPTHKATIIKEMNK